MCLPLCVIWQLLDLESDAIRSDLLRTAVDRATIMQQQIDSYMRGAGCEATVPPQNGHRKSCLHPVPFPIRRPKGPVPPSMHTHA